LPVHPADVCDATTPELDALHNNIQVATHRWARNQGYVAGVWNHEQSGNRRGVICFRVGSADVIDATTAELDVLHTNIDVAAHRWARNRGYVAGIWNHEQSGNLRGIISVRSGSADVRDATTAELNALHADIDVAAHRWACASARYVAGIWNHEQSGDRRGVICVRR